MMREVSLFTGGGGGIWGSKLLGWHTVAMCEREDYCQKVLRARQDDGSFEVCPIFSDIRTFISEGYAASYTGLVDVVSAGFPCQPFSIAGQRKGELDERNLWPQTLECICIIRPRYVLLENVPDLLTDPYSRRIFGDLAAARLDCEWDIISAEELGAPQERERLWIVSHPNVIRSRPRGDDGNTRASEAIPSNALGLCSVGELADAPADGSQGGNFSKRINSAKGAGFQGYPFGSDPGAPSGGGWWATEPGLGRVAHGMANRRNRIRALGNGQVPAVVREAWRRLAA